MALDIFSDSSFLHESILFVQYIISKQISFWELVFLIDSQSWDYWLFKLIPSYFSSTSIKRMLKVWIQVSWLFKIFQLELLILFLQNLYLRTSELVIMSLSLSYCQQDKGTHGWNPIMKRLYHLYGFTLVHEYFRKVTWKSDFVILQNLAKNIWGNCKLCDNHLK